MREPPRKTRNSKQTVAAQQLQRHARSPRAVWSCARRGAPHTQTKRLVAPSEPDGKIEGGCQSSIYSAPLRLSWYEVRARFVATGSDGLLLSGLRLGAAGACGAGQGRDAAGARRGRGLP